MPDTPGPPSRTTFALNSWKPASSQSIFPQCLQPRHSRQLHKLPPNFDTRSRLFMVETATILDFSEDTSFFNSVHRGMLPLANVGTPNPFFKVGRVFTTWFTTTWFTAVSSDIAALVPSCLLLPHTLDPLRVLFLSLPGPRVYPLPARTSRRPRGSPVGGHGDV